MNTAAVTCTYCAKGTGNEYVRQMGDTTINITENKAEKIQTIDL